MSKFKVGDVAMYRDNNEVKLVHIVDIHVSNMKRTDLFGDVHHGTKYRYVVEENSDSLQKVVWEYELVEIKNQSSYLIIPRKDTIDSIDETPARMLAAMIIEHMPELSELEGDPYYECEDRLTEFINDYKAS